MIDAKHRGSFCGMQGDRDEAVSVRDAHPLKKV
jgi:hypothetical protein